MSNNRLKLRLFQINDPAFLPAFRKLLTDTAVLNPSKEAWTLVRSVRQFETFIKDAGAVHTNLVKKYGEAIEGDPKKGIQVTAANTQAFYAEWTAAISVEVEIFLDHKIKLKEPLPPDSAITAGDLSVLFDLLDGDLDLVQGGPIDANNSKAGTEASPTPVEALGNNNNP